MKWSNEPRVYIIGENRLNDEFNRFLLDEGVEWESDAADNSVFAEIGGRLCYMSFANPRPGGIRAYVEHIKSVGHGSVLEHSVFSILIAGVSRSFSHEIIRHRAGVSPSQLSQRYVDNPVYCVPPLPAIPMVWFREAVEECDRAYHDIDKYLVAQGMGRKQAREIAREVLPNATETKLMLTCNARALRHIIELRNNPAADQQMQRVVGLIQEKLSGHVLFSDYTGQGQTPYRKV